MSRTEKRLKYKLFQTVLLNFGGKENFGTPSWLLLSRERFSWLQLRG